MKNKIFIIWGIIVFIIIGLLCTLGFTIKKNMNYYEELETKLLKAGQDYIDEKAIIMEENTTLKIKSKDLIEEDFLSELEYNHDICDGYVEVKYKEGYHYQAFIKCKRYQTRGYTSVIMYFY